MPSHTQVVRIPSKYSQVEFAIRTVCSSQTCQDPPFKERSLQNMPRSLALRDQSNPSLPIRTLAPPSLSESQMSLLGQKSTMSKHISSPARFATDSRAHPLTLVPLYLTSLVQTIRGCQAPSSPDTRGFIGTKRGLKWDTRRLVGC